MTKSSRTWWHRLLFRDKGILPTPRLIRIFFITTAAIFLASFWNLGWMTFAALNSILFFASLFDVWMLPRRNQIAFTRIIDEEIERGQNIEVGLKITNKSGVTIRFRLIDDLPESFIRPFPIKGEVNDVDTMNVSYHSKASVRGDYELENVYFRYQSSLGLWEKQMVYPIFNRVRVIPDMSQVKEYLATAQQFLLQEGIKVKKNRVGSGEFAQIRTYVTGDDPRKINWRQSAKLAELMTNIYEPEHGKHITLLIDCSRTMGIELTRGNRLERAFEAALTVAAAALRQGDYVSIMAFSNQVKTYIPPGKGLTHLQTIVRGIYNIHSDPAESNYAKAFDYLETMQKRRSFILLFSDLDPFLFQEAPLLYIQRLRRRHLFLLISIADPMTAKWIRSEPNNTKLAMVKSTAQRQMLRRKLEMRRWDRMGIEMMEVPEGQLATEALTRYIDIINRGLL